MGSKLKTATALVFIVLVIETGLAGPRRHQPVEKATIDLFGYPLPAEVVSRLGTLRFRDGGHVKGLFFTPDGKTLISESDKGVRVWDTVTGKLLHHFSVGFRTGRDIGTSLSPDGKWVVSPSDVTHPNRIWNVHSGKEVRAFGEKWFNSSVCFSSNGKRVAALASRIADKSADFRSFEEHVELWDATSGQPLRSWNTRRRLGKNGNSYSRLFYANEKTLITGGGGKVCVWDVDQGRLRREIAIDAVIRPLALSPDGSLLATIADRDGGQTSCIRIVDMANGKDRRLLIVADKKPEIPPVWSRTFNVMTFARDGKTLVTASIDGTVIVWDLSTGKELRRFALGLSYPRALALSADGKTLAAARDSVIRLIDMTTGKDRFPEVGHQLGVLATAVSADGRIAATACPKRIVLWDTATGRELRRLQDLPYEIAGIKMIGDGRDLLSLGYDMFSERLMLQTWDLLTGKEIHRVEWKVKHAAPPRLLAVSPDGKTVALELRSFSSRDKMALLDLATGKVRRRFDLEGEKFRIQGVSFTADGRAVVVWSSGVNRVRLWDVATGRELRQFVLRDKYGKENADGTAFVAAVSPTGRHLVFGSPERFLAVYDIDTGREINRSAELDDNPNNGGLMVFSPSGKTLAWLGGDRRTVHLVEGTTFHERRSFVTPQGEIASLTFSCDGKMLLAGNTDTTTLVWDLTGGLRDKARGGNRLPAGKLNAYWADLATNDGPRVHRAIHGLAASPKEAIPYLQTRLQPVATMDSKQVLRLIAELDSEDFDTRDNATRELDTLEERALGFYRQALQAKPSLELRRRLLALVEKYSEPWRNPSRERLRSLRILEVLELADTPEARQILEGLAKGASESWLTVEAKEALDRLRRRSSQEARKQ